MYDEIENIEMLLQNKELKPFLPETSDKIIAQLNLKPTDFSSVKQFTLNLEHGQNTSSPHLKLYFSVVQHFYLEDNHYTRQTLPVIQVRYTTLIN